MEGCGTVGASGILLVADGHVCALLTTPSVRRIEKWETVEGPRKRRPRRFYVFVALPVLFYLSSPG
jgi:hypothetical protein